MEEVENQPSKLIGQQVIVYRFDGTTRKATIKVVTDKAILLKDNDGVQQAWLPKTIWAQHYYCSPMLGVTITIPKSFTLIWRVPEKQ